MICMKDRKSGCVCAVVFHRRIMSIIWTFVSDTASTYTLLADIPSNGEASEQWY
jgi:hypothetical protein